MLHIVLPDWQAIVSELHASMSDGAIADRVAFEGVVIDRSTITSLRSGRNRWPSYPLGAALLNLYQLQKQARPSALRYHRLVRAG